MSDDERLLPLSASQREALEEATASYASSLTRETAEYLKGRGIDKTMAQSFRLGLVADPFPGHERMRGWLAIPYLDKDDRPLSIRFRCLRSGTHVCRELGHGKYLSITDEPTRVFNVRAIHRADEEIHVSEGELDAVILNKVGLPAVAIPGARAWAGHRRRMLAGFNRIYVWGDPDDAGAEFVQKVTRSLRNARGVRLKGGDVTDTYMTGGADALLGLVSRGEESAA